MSRMSAVRSMILTLLSTVFSRFDCCDGVSSSSNMTRSAAYERASWAISSALPVPTNVRGLGDSSFCVVFATVSAPAVSARRSSSASEESRDHFWFGRSTPTRIARSLCSSNVVCAPLVSTEANCSMLIGLPFPRTLRRQVPSS